MFKRLTTNRNTQEKTTQQRLTWALKNAGLLPDRCCCLGDKGNDILFRMNISQPHTTVTGLDGAGQWVGPPGHRTSHQLTSSYWATLKSWFTRRQVLLKRILSPVLLKQQQPPGRNVEFLRANAFLCCFVVCCVLRSVAVRLNTRSKLVRNTTLFFRILQWFCLISNLSDPIWQSVALQGCISDIQSLDN